MKAAAASPLLSRTLRRCPRDLKLRGSGELMEEILKDPTLWLKESDRRTEGTKEQEAERKQIETKLIVRRLREKKQVKAKERMAERGML